MKYTDVYRMIKMAAAVKNTEKTLLRKQMQDIQNNQQKYYPSVLDMLFR